MQREVSPLPIESATYRRWNGKATSPTRRIFSLGMSDLIGSIKRPAVIVVIILFSLYIIFTGLTAIMGSLFTDDNIFLEDRNPDYNGSLISEIELISTTILDPDGSNPEIIENDIIREVRIDPGEWVLFTLKVTNKGDQEGNFNVYLNPSSSASNPDQWFPLIMLSDEVDENISKLRNGIDIFGGEKNEETTRDDRPQTDPKEGIEGDISLFGQLIYGQSIPLTLSPDGSESIGVLVISTPGSHQDLLDIIVMLRGEPENEFIEGDFQIEFMGEMSPENQISAAIPLAISVAPENGDSTEFLKDQIEIEIVQAYTRKKVWTGNNILNDNMIPDVTWDREFTFQIEVTNIWSSTLYVASFYGLREPVGISSINYLTTDLASGQTMIPPGQTRTINLTYKPDSMVPPKLYYASIGLYVSETELNIHGSNGETDGGLFGKNYDYVVGENIERTNESFVIISHHLNINSRQYKIDDGTAEFFFNLFYTGGIPIPIFFIAVLAGSGLIAHDRANKIIPLYYSRAIPRYGYLIGKFSALTSLLFISTAVLSNLWFIAVMFLGNFSLDFIISHLWIMGAFTGFGLIVSVLLSAIVLAGSSLGKNKYMIGASVLALFLLLPIVTAIVSAMVNNNHIMLLSPTYNLLNIGLKIFGTGSLPVDWQYSALVIAGIILGSLGLLYYQMMRREEVVK